MGAGVKPLGRQPAALVQSSQDIDEHRIDQRRIGRSGRGCRRGWCYGAIKRFWIWTRLSNQRLESLQFPKTLGTVFIRGARSTQNVTLSKLRLYLWMDQEVMIDPASNGDGLKCHCVVREDR